MAAPCQVPAPEEVISDLTIDHRQMRQTHWLERGWRSHRIAVRLQGEQPRQQLLRMPLHPLEALHRPAHLHKQSQHLHCQAGNMLQYACSGSIKAGIP